MASSEEEAQSVRFEMTNLLLRLRIEATIIIVDKNRKPSAEGLAAFQAMSECSEEDMHDERVVHFINISEEMRRYSCYASMVVASLPIPKEGVGIKRYMSYLEILSDTRPTILIRGNQDTVLTVNS